MRVRFLQSSSGARALPAFTLIELLVTIAVISLLIGILAPSLGVVRDAGRSARCSSNLRQWANAVNIYASENKGFLPRRGQGIKPTTNLARPTDWFNALPSFLGDQSYRDRAARNRIARPGDRTVWMCPSATEVDVTNYFAYGMSMQLSTWELPQPDRIDTVSPVSSQVFLTDGPGTHGSLIPSDQPYSPAPRHRRSLNIAFLDTHVSAFSGASIGCGIGDPLRSDVIWSVRR